MVSCLFLERICVAWHNEYLWHEKQSIAVEAAGLLAAELPSPQLGKRLQRVESLALLSIHSLHRDSKKLFYEVSYDTMRKMFKTFWI
jgi:hypothetical protein